MTVILKVGSSRHCQVNPAADSGKRRISMYSRYCEKRGFSQPAAQQGFDSPLLAACGLRKTEPVVSFLIGHNRSHDLRLTVLQVNDKYWPLRLAVLPGQLSRQAL